MQFTAAQKTQHIIITLYAYFSDSFLSLSVFSDRIKKSRVFNFRISDVSFSDDLS